MTATEFLNLNLIPKAEPTPADPALDALEILNYLNTEIERREKLLPELPEGYWLAEQVHAEIAQLRDLIAIEIGG